MRITPEEARSMGLVQDAKGNWVENPTEALLSPPPKDFVLVNPKRIRQSGRPLNYENKPDRLLPDTIAQCDQASTLDATIPREAQGDGRTRIRFTGCRVRPLDPDNFAGSVKDLLDGLRHAGIISGDEPWRIILETEQIKVPKFRHERTMIEITTLP